MKKIAFAAAALLALPWQAWAAEPIRWPNAWGAKPSLVYETESLDNKTAPGKRESTRSTSRTTVRIAKASADGFVQEWVSKKPTFEVIEGDKSQAEVMRAALKAFDGYALSVQLDKDGNYQRIANIDAVSAHMRKVMRPVMIAGADSQLRQLDKAAREKTRPQVMQQVESTLEQMTTPAVVETMVGRIIQTYNGFAGVELEPDQWYELETELANPIGGRNFPAKLQVLVYPSEEDPDDIFLEWNSAIDEKKGADALWETVEKLFGRKISKKERKKLPKQIAINDKGFFLFRRDTGVIEMFDMNREVKVGDREQVQRERMRLVNGDHDHQWNTDPDEEDAGSG